MSKEARYLCPLDGSPLRRVDPGWYCPHENHKSSDHHTLLAFDTEKGLTVRQQGVGTIEVNNQGKETDLEHTCPEGHRSVYKGVDGYYCKACEEQYDGDPTNLKEEAKV